MTVNSIIFKTKINSKLGLQKIPVKSIYLNSRLANILKTKDKES